MGFKTDNLEVTGLAKGEGLVNINRRSNGMLDWYGGFYAKYYKLGSDIAVAGNPRCLAYCPYNNCIYVCNSTTSNISRISCSTGTVVQTITVGTAPGEIAYCPSNNTMYVVNNTDADVSPINCYTNTRGADISVGTASVSSPQGIAYCPTNNKMYVVINANDTVIPILCEYDTIDTAIPFVGDAPRDIVYCPSNDHMYIGDSSSGEVNIIDCGNDTLGTPIEIESKGMAYCPTNNSMYCADLVAKEVNVLDCSDNSVVATITCAGALSYVAYNPATNIIYVTGGVHVQVMNFIDCASNTISAPELTLGSGPLNIVYCPYNGLMYVSNYNDSDVSLLVSF